jgi:hypothetical protein
MWLLQFDSIEKDLDLSSETLAAHCFAVYNR